jgi:hypothetical protein
VTQIGLLDAMLARVRRADVRREVGGELLKNALARRIATELAVLHQLGIKVVLVHGGGPLDDAARAATSRPERRWAAHHDAGAPRSGHRQQRTSRPRSSRSTSRAARRSDSRARRRSPPRGPAASTDCHRRRGERRTVDYGLVGDLREVRADILYALLAIQSFRSPLALGRSGQALNVNTDTVAAEIAVALKAAKLVLASARHPREPRRSRVGPPLDRSPELQQLLEQGSSPAACPARRHPQAPKRAARTSSTDRSRRRSSSRCSPRKGGNARRRRDDMPAGRSMSAVTDLLEELVSIRR